MKHPHETLVQKKKKKRNIMLFAGIGIGVLAASSAAILASTISSGKTSPVSWTLTFDKGTGTSIEGNTSMTFAPSQTETLESIQQTQGLPIPRKMTKTSISGTEVEVAFVGWKLQDSDLPISAKQELKSSTRLSAVFADDLSSRGITYHTIVFETSDPKVWLSGISSMAVIEGRTLGSINKPKVNWEDENKYAFKGWARKGYENVILSEDLVITTDLILVPTFSEVINITFVPDPGTIKSGSQTMKAEVGQTWGQTNTPEVYYDTTHLFEGWYKDAAKKIKWKAEDVIETTSSTMAYAKFVAIDDPEYCTIEFIQNTTSEQPTVEFVGTIPAAAEKGKTWADTARPTATASGWKLSKWEYSLDGTSGWQELKDDKQISESKLYVRPVMAHNIEAVTVLGDNLIYKGQSKLYTGFSFPEEVADTLTFNIQKSSSDESAVPDVSFVASTEADNTVVVTVSPIATSKSFYIKATSSISPTVWGGMNVTITEPYVKSYDYFTQIQLPDDTEVQWYNLDKETLCNSENENILLTRELPDGTTKEFEIPRAEFGSETYPTKVYVGDKIDEIPDGFLNNCTGFNQPVVLTANVKMIGNGFLSGCTNFNNDISNLDTVEVFGEQFLQGCSNFNKPLTLSNSKRIKAYFLKDCTAFNSALNLGTKITNIGSITSGGEDLSFFLYNCTSFNQNLTFPASVVKVSDFCMRNCNNFNSIIYVNCVPSVVFTENDQSFSSEKFDSNFAKKGFEVGGNYDKEFLGMFPSKAQAGGQFLPSVYRKVTYATQTFEINGYSSAMTSWWGYHAMDKYYHQKWEPSTSTWEYDFSNNRLSKVGKKVFRFSGCFHNWDDAINKQPISFRCWFGFKRTVYGGTVYPDLPDESTVASQISQFVSKGINVTLHNLKRGVTYTTTLKQDGTFIYAQWDNNVYGRYHTSGDVYTMTFEIPESVGTISPGLVIRQLDFSPLKWF